MKEILITNSQTTGDVGEFLEEAVETGFESVKSQNINNNSNNNNSRGSNATATKNKQDYGTRSSLDSLSVVVVVNVDGESANCSTNTCANSDVGSGSSTVMASVTSNSTPTLKRNNATHIEPMSAQTTTIGQRSHMNISPSSTSSTSREQKRQKRLFSQQGRNNLSDEREEADNDGDGDYEMPKKLLESEKNSQKIIDNKVDDEEDEDDHDKDSIFDSDSEEYPESFFTFPMGSKALTKMQQNILLSTNTNNNNNNSPSANKTKMTPCFTVFIDPPTPQPLASNEHPPLHSSNIQTHHQNSVESQEYLPDYSAKCALYNTEVGRSESFHDRLSRVFCSSKYFSASSSAAAAAAASSQPTRRLGMTRVSSTQRFSIFGQPFPVSSKISFFSQRVFVYNFLQRPRGWVAYSYHSFLGSMIILALILFALTTVPSMKVWPLHILRYLDILIFMFLSVEFVALCWSASCVVKYQHLRGRLRFLFSPFRLLDLTVIVSTGIVLWLHWNAENREQHIKLGWIRSLQIVQILRLENRFKAWRLFSSVIWLQRKHLLIISYMAFLILIVISYVVYFIEQRDPSTPFKNIPTSLWWGIISVMTIGYGDVVPVTPEGKIIGGIMSVVGAIIYAIPAGIIATGLALKVQESNRQKHMNKRTIPAARLIQRAWRCYAASRHSYSEATWKSAAYATTKALLGKKNRVKKLSDWSLGGGEKSFEGKFVSKNARFYLIDENDENVSQYSGPSSQADLYRMGGSVQGASLALTDTQKNAIRFIRILRFQLALKEFKNAFKPYDIQDVLQQYSEGHADVIGRVRFMQNRIDNVQIGLSTVCKLLSDATQSQERRLEVMERKIDSLVKLVEIQNIKLYSRTGHQRKSPCSESSTIASTSDYFESSSFADTSPYPSVFRQSSTSPRDRRQYKRLSECSSNNSSARTSQSHSPIEDFISSSSSASSPSHHRRRRHSFSR